MNVATMEDDTTASLIPSSVDFNNGDIERAVNRPKLRANTWYQLKVLEAEISAAKTGTLQYRMRVAPLNRDGQVKNPATTYKLNLPFANPRKQGHTAPNTVGFCHAFLHAIYPKDFPQYPRWDKAQNGFVAQDGTGTVMNKEAAEIEKRRIATSVLNRIKEYFGDVQQLVGEVFYGQTDDTDWRNIEAVSATEPDDASVCYENFVESDVV